MGKFEFEHNGEQKTFNTDSEWTVINLIQQLSLADEIPVEVLFILDKSEYIFQMVISKLGWDKVKFQKLINLATQNEKKYPGLSKKIHSNLPFAIQVETKIENIQTQPIQDAAGGGVLKEALAVAGIAVVGVGISLKEFVSGSEMLFKAPITIRDLVDPLKQELGGLFNHFQVVQDGNRLVLKDGKTELGSILVTIVGRETKVQTVGLNINKALNDVGDTAKKTLEVGGEAFDLYGATQRGDLDAVSEIATHLISSVTTLGSSAMESAATFSLPIKVVAIVRGVCGKLVQAYEEKEVGEGVEIVKLQNEIKNALECIACGSPRIDGQSCNKCSYPYQGQKLTEAQIIAKTEEIKKMKES